MSTPKHNAYKPVAVSNGIVEGTHHTFDTTVPMTADDQAALEQFGHVSLPLSRILRMQEQIAALDPVTNPYIRAHVDNIREIHKRLLRFSDPRPQFTMEQWENLPEEERIKHRAYYVVTEAEKALLERADYLWAMIVAIPLADTGKRVHDGHKNRDDHADKQEFIRLVQQLNKQLKCPPRTVKGWKALKEIAPYSAKYAGKNTIRNWIKEALPGVVLKTGRPEKRTVIR
ncbi:MAG: hypothetical protein WB870_17030 [Gallionellaceae bacterium]